MKFLSSTWLLGLFMSSFGANAITVTLYKPDGGTPNGFAVNADGSCFDLHGGLLQQYNDQLGFMKFPAGYTCTLWKDYGCHGAHSDAFHADGGKVPIGDICTNGLAGSSKWPGLTSSFKCCPAGAWCAGGQPKCT
ncbi:hypothetical protein RBB50_003185 [Rhinocladiella similis]